MKLQLHHGDCLDVLRTLADNSVDSIVTDPPYGLTANKKGGSGAASVNLESPYGRARISTGNGAGGFMGMKWDADVPSVEIWAECLRVLKPGGHLLAFAGTRTQHRMACRIEDAGFEIRDLIAWVYGSGFPKSHNGDWGGTALKPALEPITLARKPLTGTVAANVLAHGTGALNIDGCRVAAGDDYTDLQVTQGGQTRFTQDGANRDRAGTFTPATGRWPANLVHDGSDEVLAAFPAASSVTGKRSAASQAANVAGTAWLMGNHESTEYTDSGSPARFFYCAKASRSDRNDGGAQNVHPTVKPTALMRWLVRLVTPPGGVVLDPFMGSGSTGRGAILEGFGFVGIEREAAYVDIAEARISAVQEQLKAEAAIPAQAGLFGELA